MKKSIFSFTIILIMTMAVCLCLFGCGETNNGNNSSAKFDNAAIKNSLSIDDFDWSVDRGVYSGVRAYALSITNNSKYDLIGVEIGYKLKDDVTDDQLKLFDDFKQSHSDWIDEGDELILRGFRDIYIPSNGGSADTIGLAIGIGTSTWQDLPTEEQFSAMTPDYLSVALVSNKNIYWATYDFINSTWHIEKTVNLIDWPDNVSQILEKPECSILYVTDTGSLFSATAYGVDNNYFNQYLEKVISAGFTVDSSKLSSFYYANNENGDKISLEYNDVCKSIEINLYFAEEQSHSLLKQYKYVRL